MTRRFGKTARTLLPALALLAIGTASASTLNQNVSWTIDRSGTTAKYRLVAYGDSIYAGYNGSTTSAANSFHCATCSVLTPAEITMLPTSVSP